MEHPGPLGKPLALAAAAGALMAGIASVGGPSRTRGRALLMMTGMLGLSVALGLLVGEQALLAAAVVGVFAFGFAMIAAANPLYVSLATISVSYMVSYASQACLPSCGGRMAWPLWLGAAANVLSELDVVAATHAT
ncbi:hypothetical protein [Deinococcus radiophilus]|uniref:hypothetical protein n=1 Tax=Deinococcus radiophilus TaxID=32062 RepID=UPI0036111E13